MIHSDISHIKSWLVGLLNFDQFQLSVITQTTTLNMTLTTFYTLNLNREGQVQVTKTIPNLVQRYRRGNRDTKCCMSRNSS